MSLSLLMALLEPKPSDLDNYPDLASNYETWSEAYPERKELMLQAVYQALNEVLYKQATIDPEARTLNRVFHTQAALAPQDEQTKARQAPQAGRAVGSLLAQVVSNDPQRHPTSAEDIQELRKKLREELHEHLERLRRQYPNQTSYTAGGLSSST